jgi:hypothetical protein
MTAGAFGFRPAPSAGEPAAAGDPQQRLLYAEEAAQRIAARIEELRRQPDPPCAEIARLKGYLERVEAQLAAERAGLPATTTRPRGSAATTAQPGRARFEAVPVTTEQDLMRRRELALEKSLGRFDELLLREVEMASERSAERSSRAAGASRGAAGGDGEGQGSGDSGAAGDTGGDMAAGTAQGRAGAGGQAAATEGQGDGAGPGGRAPAADGEHGRGGPGGRGSGSRTPPDIPDGSDDDIVARQIRAAAEAEQDPALREKLWQEYRDYKNSRR